jgi:4-hydroxy-tetrahydrodipicolinate synthase
VTGAWVAIPTPFDADGAHVDEDALAASVEHYVEALRVDGIFCGGVMGEFWALTLAERKRVHELVAETARGRVPVMAQVGHHAFADTVALCDHALEHGIDFGIAMNPYYPPSPPDELVRNWYERLGAATTLPMFLFNTAYSGYSLAPELIAELADIEIVCGVKNPQPREHLLRVHELCGDRIVVTDAAERHWLELNTKHGIRALMSSPAPALYQTPGNTPIADYTRLAAAGDVDAARAISDTLGPPRDAFDRWMRAPWLDRRVIPIAELKAWLGLMGLPQGPVRPPLVPLSEGRLAELRAELERLELVA